MKDRTRILPVSTFGIHPAALRTLNQLSMEASYHLEYGFRPPLGIYNVSLAQIVSTAIAVAQEVEKLRSQWSHSAHDPNWDSSYLDKQAAFLYALMQHMDDCMHLLRGFFRPGVNWEKDSHVKK